MVLIMEYCNGGELFNKICAESEACFRLFFKYRVAQAFKAYVNTHVHVYDIQYIPLPNENLRKEVDELKVATFMYQICAAMKYIHSRNVIHLDLKVTKPLVIEPNLSYHS